jgi:S-formylglutathione hydrolase FrmB
VARQEAGSLRQQLAVALSDDQSERPYQDVRGALHRRYRLFFATFVAAIILVAGAATPSLGLGLDRDPDLIATPAAAALPPSPSRIVEASLDSISLGFAVPYLVFLPPGYDSQPERIYPAIYMLHGLGGDRYQARVDGLFSAADAMMTSGEIGPMIIVAPEGQSSYWVNHANNGPHWGDYITVDLVREIDARYRTIPEPESRAIGGVSMGGHGALQLAMNSNQFGVVGAHSVALRTYEQAFPMFGDRSYFEAHDPVHLCARYVAHARSLKIWIDIGDTDPWNPAATAFHNQLTASAIPHEWHVYAGGHDVDYWRAHAPDYLRFYNRALAKARA